MLPSFYLVKFKNGDATIFEATGILGDMRFDEMRDTLDIIKTAAGNWSFKSGGALVDLLEQSTSVSIHGRGEYTREQIRRMQADENARAETVRARLYSYTSVLKR